MRAIVIIVDERGSHSAELPKGRITLGGSEADSILLHGEGVCEAHVSLTWEARYATWRLVRNAAADAAVSVNGRALASQLPVALNNLDTLRIGAVDVRFFRMPDPPLFRDAPVTELPLFRGTLVLGRPDLASSTVGGAPAAAEGAKLDLDPDDIGISKTHAVIEWEDGSFYLRDTSKLGTELNTQSFTRAMLVYGDRFRIRDYIFEFTGHSIRRIDQAGRGSVSAHNLVMDVDIRGEPLRLLNNINLEIMGGEFIGILGGSGQGKSTLLNALCGINPATGGEVLIGGLPLLSRERINAAAVGFVPQDDIVHMELTVWQAITYSAQLRLKLPSAQIAALVERTMARLSLTEHKDKRIARISGGQRKRVSVAIELLALPSVLYLDEPSSGLDPAKEAELMELLQTLQKTNMTVICTTHVLQKAYLFDRVFFIQKGRLVFAGKADEARQFFLMQDAPQRDTASGFFDKFPLSNVYTLIDSSPKSAEEWEAEYLASPYYRDRSATEFPVLPEEATANDAPPAAQPRVAYLTTLGILFDRQWRILLADVLNLRFLFAQPLAIGIMIGWVAGNAGLRMFLCVVAALWFGTSNGAQQIVSEIAIFRRERVYGLGLNVYLQSKLVFLSLLTAAQALILFLTIFVTAHFLHPVEFDQADFSTRLIERLGGGNAALEDNDADAGGAGAVGKPASKPAPYQPSRATLGLAGLFANFFYLKDNYLDSGPQPVLRENGLPERGADHRPVVLPGLSLLGVTVTTLGLKALSLLGVAFVGVSLGLTVSALVRSNTQAVMWVPLILIPQILFGGFVVAVPDMSASVFWFSHLVPSFSAQRIMDVSNLYGQQTPLMTNRTKVPLFLTADGSKDKIEWRQDGQVLSQDYDRISLFNNSWQNMVVYRDRVGQHKAVRVKTDSPFRKEYLDTVDTRNDVRYARGTVFRFVAPAEISLLTLVVWGAACYGITLLGLRSKQTGK